MAATSRRRRICCRSAGAWATAAPRPLASPLPGPPRSPRRTSSPESTFRRRCPWLRTQVSAGWGGRRRGSPAPGGHGPGPSARLFLLSSERVQRSLRFHFSAPALVAAQARSGSAPGLGAGSSRFRAAVPGVLEGQSWSSLKVKPFPLPPSLAPACRRTQFRGNLISFLHSSFTSLRHSEAGTTRHFLREQNACCDWGWGWGDLGRAEASQIRAVCAG